MAIVRNDVSVLNSQEPLIINATDYPVFFHNLFNKKIMGYLEDAYKAAGHEEKFGAIFEKFNEAVQRYGQAMIQNESLYQLLTELDNLDERPRSIFYGLAGNCEAVQNQVTAALLGYWAQAYSGGERYKERVGRLLNILEEYLINNESNEETDILDVVIEEPAKLPELIRIAIMVCAKEGLLNGKIKMAWHYGDVIKKCRLKNIRLEKVDVPSVSLGRVVLHDLKEAVYKLPAPLLWKVDPPIPVSVVYERRSEDRPYQVVGSTSSNPTNRGSIELTVKGKIATSSVINIIIHEVIHSLTYSKMRNGKWLLPLEDWKAITKVAHFYGYYDQYKQRVVGIEEINDVEDILRIPYVLWIYQEGEQLVNYVTSQDNITLILANGAKEGMKRGGVVFRNYDEKKDWVQYAKSDPKECAALSLEEPALVHVDVGVLNVPEIKRILARNCLREEFPQRVDGKEVFMSWTIHGEYWHSKPTQEFIENGGSSPLTFPDFEAPSLFSDFSFQSQWRSIGEFDTLNNARKAVLSTEKVVCHAKVLNEPTLEDLKALVKTGSIEIGLAKNEGSWFLFKGLRGGVMIPFNECEFKLHSHPKRITKEIKRAQDTYTYPEEKEEENAKERGKIEYVLTDKGLCAYGAGLEKPIFASWKELFAANTTISTLGNYFLNKQLEAKKGQLGAENSDEKYLLSKSAKYLKNYPVNMRIDLTTIPRSGLTEEQQAEQLEQNMETLARLIAWHNTLGLNVRYILEHDIDAAYRDKASTILKEKLTRLAAIPGIDVNELLLHVGPPHTGDGVIEVLLKNLDSIKGMQSIPDRAYYVALKDDPEKPGVAMPNYTAAANMGLSLAALRIAKEKTTEKDEYNELREKVLRVFRNIYKRYEIISEEEKFTTDELELMVVGSSDTRLYYTILYALPPIVKAAIEELRKYHESLHLLLQAA